MRETDPETRSDNPSGGPGGVCESGIRTTRLLNRALRSGWDIPSGVRDDVVDRLAKVVRDPDAGAREVVSAASALIAADRVNLAAIDAAIRAETHEDVLKRVEELERAASQQKGVRR